jgi:hypothetical protein
MAIVNHDPLSSRLRKALGAQLRSSADRTSLAELGLGRSRGTSPVWLVGEAR